jgi:hypothetical protein
MSKPEKLQQNLEKPPPKPRPTVFKPGYDPRRWLKGRGKKSPEQREGEKILRAVIWEELSREFDTNGMKPLENPETIDALRLMVRTWIKKHPQEVAERIAGKVPASLELTGKAGAPLVEIGVRLIDYRVGIAEAESRSGGDNSTPSQDKSSGDGA